MCLFGTVVDVGKSRPARAGDIGVQADDYRKLEYADLHQEIERFLQDRGKRGVKI